MPRSTPFPSATMKRKGKLQDTSPAAGDASNSVADQGKGHPAPSAHGEQEVVEPEDLPRGEAAAVALLFFYALGVYVLTLPPTVVGGDSGEIVVAAWTLAVPHPPG